MSHEAANVGSKVLAALDAAGICAVLHEGERVTAATAAAGLRLQYDDPVALAGTAFPARGEFGHLRRKDGVVLSCRFWRHAVGDSTLSIFQDATAAEAPPHANEERYRAIFEGASDGIFLADDRGFYIDANGAGCRLLGIERTDLLGRHLTEFIFEADLQASPPQYRNLPPGHTQRTHRRLRRSDGALVPVEISSSVLPDGILQGVVRDLTEQLRTEEALRQATKLDAIGRLSGGVAHDFNNLLAIFQSIGEELRRRPPNADPGSLLDELQEAVDSGAALTRQILTFARRAPTNPAVIDLAETLGRFAALLERTLGEDVRLVIAPTEVRAWVRLDPGHLEQVLLNLAVNSRDAMPRGGVLSFAVAQEGDSVVLTVADSGQGMTEETLQHVFEPFFTTKKPGQGTGLGLATVHGIVTSAGGSVSVESRVGLGTSFRLRFPTVQAPLATPLAAPVPFALARALMVLLVEDDSQVRLALQRTLLSLGHAVLLAADAAEALALLQAGPHIGLVVTDVVLPHLAGDELARRIRQVRPALPIVFVTGYQAEASLRELGPVVTKPFTAAALGTAIQHELERRRPVKPR